MAQTIKLKRSAQSGASGIPSTSDLALGEVGINTYHGKMYIKKDDGTESIVEVGSTGSFLPLSGGTLTGNLSLGTNNKAIFNSQLEIYGDGSHSYISDVGTGNLIIKGTHLNLRDANNTLYMEALQGGAVTLRHAGNISVATTSTGIDVTGSVTADGLTVDSGSGNIGIVTKSTDQFAFIGFEDNTSATSSVYIGADGNDFIARANSVTRLRAASNGDISFYNDSANQGLFFDSSTSRLGLGVTNPASTLDILGNKDATNVKISAALNTVGGGSLADYSEILFDNTQVSGTSGQAYLRHYANSHNDQESAIAFGTTTTGGTTSEALRIRGDGSSVFSGAVTSTGLTVNSPSATFSNTNTMDLNIVGNPPELNLEDTGSNSGTKRVRLTLDSNLVGLQGLNDADSAITQDFMSASLSSGNIAFNSGNVNIPNGGLMVGATTAPTDKVDVAGAIRLTSNISFDANKSGRIYKASNHGLAFHGVTGTENDFALFTPSGQLMVVNPTGTNNVALVPTASSGRVGIGTSSPIQKLHVAGNIVLNASGFVGFGGGTNYIEGSSTNLLKFGTNNIERMRIDSSGNVGIGCSPSTQMELSFAETVLQAKSTNASNFSSIRSMNSDSNQTAIIQYGASKAAYGAFGSGESAFYSTTATTIMSDNSSSGVIKFATGGNTERMRLNADGSCRWTPDGTNHDMTLTAGGDLLVGKTSADFTTAGHEIKPNSFAGFTRDGGAPVVINRLTNSGHLVEFYQGTSSVGSIASVDANSIKIGKGNSNLRFYDFGASGVGIIPCTSTGANSLNAVDLGNASSTFKDLYLSGGVIGGGAIQSYAGTTGAAAFRPNNDLNTGIFFPAADTFAVTTGGSEAYRVDSFGNLLVGTNDTDTQNNNAGSVADNGFVYNKGSGGYLNVARYGGTVAYFNRTSSVGTIQEFRADGVTKGNISVSSFGMGFGGGTRSSDFFIKTDGTASFASGVNVGIGTGSPSRELDIQASSGWAELALRGASGSAGSLEYFNASTKLADIYADTSTNIIFRNSTGGTTERARITSGGEFLIGCTSAGDGGITLDGSPSSNSVPSMELVRDFSGTATMIRFTNISGSPYVGSITSTTSATAYNTSSDERLKDNIKDADDSGSKVDAIQVRQFDWKADGEHQDYGMVAQELLEVAPDAVTQGDTPDDMMGVDYSKLVPMLIKEIQSLRQRVAQLEV